MIRILLSSILTGVLLLAGLSGCATNPATGGTDFVLMSEEQELSLGRKLHPQVLKEYGRYEDAALQSYVQKVGDRLTRASDRPELIYRFTVVDSPVVNAFALPGGYIYISRGLMAHLNSEAQLAGVLAHELGHVTARHSVRQYSQRTLIGILGAVAASAANVPGGGDLMRVLGTAIVRGYGRSMELEADRLGARYLARAGYPPQAMMEVIRILKAQETFEKRLAKEEGREPRTYHGLFSTHPDNDTRLQEVIQAAERQEIKGGSPRISRETYLRHIDGLVFGDSKREGIRRANRFYHAELGFALAFPRGWVIENLSDRLIGRTRDGVARIQMFTDDLNKRMTPRAYLEGRLKLKDLKSGRSLRIAGLDGYTAIAASRSRVAVIFMQHRAYTFVGTVRKGEAVLSKYDTRFLDTIASFHRLKPTERHFAEPLRIAIHHVQPGDTIRRLAEASPLPHHAEAKLRLLNGLFPADEPRVGTLFKIVE